MKFMIKNNGGEGGSAGYFCRAGFVQSGRKLPYGGAQLV
jgi:hypothetical protein